MSYNKDVSSVSDDASVASSDAFTSVPKFKCKECNSMFVKRYNLQRHIKTIHEASDTESDEDENESDESMSEDEACSSEENTTSDEDMSDDERSSVTSDEELDEKYVPHMFRKIAIKAYKEHGNELDPIVKEYMADGMTEADAMKYALLSSDTAKKRLRSLYVENVIFMAENNKHPLFKAIMEKADELIDEGFDACEAIKAAVAYRKHAIYDLVNYL